jgi:hypothetical protein
LTDPITEVAASIAVVSGVVTAAIHYIRLSTRRVSRPRQVLTSPGGRFVRISLLIAAGGVLLLASGWEGWTVFAIWCAILACELTVTTLVRRSRQGRTSRKLQGGGNA